MKPGFGYAVVDKRTSSLSSALAHVTEDGQVETVGTYFIAVYLRRKEAKKMAAQWRGARVVKVRITEEPSPHA